jgi:hypothetical protein
VLSVVAASVLSACGGAGGSSSPATIPAASSSGRAVAAASVRREIAQPTSTGSGISSFVGGGDSNVAEGEWSTVGAGVGDDACASQSSILGGGYNGIDTGSAEATISGGYENAESGAPDSAIGGGRLNVVTAQYGAIASGSLNTVSGAYGFDGGGQRNSAGGAWGTIGGGYGNQAAEIATVPGGKNNLATGEGSFAAGVGSTAGYAGDFVWSDFASGATALKGSAANQFLARASGGVTFYSSPTLASGVKLAAGSGTWASLSDRNAKSGIVPVSDDDILARVATLPISKWSYTTERGVRHVGPMAQDFFAAFNVGEDDRHITSIDEDGVALAAIKALNERQSATNATLARKDAQIQALQRSDADLRRQMAQLAGEVNALRRSHR